MKKGIFFILAIVFLVLGMIGLILPIIPQVPFLVLGVLFLTASSERFKTWLFNNSLYKKYLKHYVDNSKLLNRFMKYADISDAGTDGAENEDMSQLASEDTEKREE